MADPRVASAWIPPLRERAPMFLSRFSQQSKELVSRVSSTVQETGKATATQIHRRVRAARNEFIEEILSGWHDAIGLAPTSWVTFQVQFLWWALAAYLGMEWWPIEISILFALFYNNSFDSSEGQVRFFLRWGLSRFLTYWCYTGGIFEFPFDMELLVLPLGLSWYVFEPQLILNGRSYGERFDYFSKRLPYFTGFGLFGGISAYFDSFRFCHLVVLFMLYSSSIDRIKKTRPQYAQKIPYTKTTFNFDPIELFESIL